MELVKIMGDSAIYSLETIHELNNSAIAGLPWPDSISRLKFILNKSDSRECEISLRKISRKYIAMIVYSAYKRELIKPAIENSKSPVTLRSPKDIEKLKRLYKKTDTEYFYKPWRNYLTPKYLKEMDSFISTDLSLSGSACLLKKAEVVGLVNMVKWKDYFEVPVDWISWVWIDRRLSDLERKHAHFQLVRWIKRKTVKRVQCVVHSFNTPSQKFFRKIGFKPVCIHISKRA